MEPKAVSMWIQRAAWATSACLVLMFLAVTPLHAQVDTGTILGTVTDASGAAIRGANVTLTNEGTSASLATTTGSDGIYKFTPVKIGSYSIKVSFQGFQAAEKRGVTQALP